MKFTSVSKPSEAFASFKGPLINYYVVRSIDREKGLLRRWTVFSQGKRSVLVKYLFGKLLWDELNSFEKLVFWTLTEITQERTIYLSLKALILGCSKRDLRRRLEKSPFEELRYITRQQYLSIKGRVNFFFLEETVTLRSVPKFTGYTKHHKDKGSLGPQRYENISEVLDPISDISEEILLEYLTVGKFPLFGGRIDYPDE